MIPYVQNPWKNCSPQTFLSSPRGQPQQSLSVSLLSRTVLLCVVNYILSTSGQWQHFCSLFGEDFWSFWHYWPPNSPLPPELCFWHSVYCTPVVSLIPLRHQSTSVNNLSSSPSQLMYGMPQGSVLGPVLFIMYTTPLSDIIANHSVNHQLFCRWHTAPEIHSSVKLPTSTMKSMHAQMT